MVSDFCLAARRDQRRLNGEILQTQVRWFTVTTLNNRALIVNPKAMRRIWLLAEEHDEPENGDFVDIGDAITGWPLELYRGLSEWLHATMKKPGTRHLQEVPLCHCCLCL